MKLPIEEYLDVAMDDAHGVHVRETLRQRDDDLEGLLLRQNGSTADVLV